MYLVQYNIFSCCTVTNLNSTTLWTSTYTKHISFSAVHGCYSWSMHSNISSTQEMVSVQSAEFFAKDPPRDRSIKYLQWAHICAYTHTHKMRETGEQQQQQIKNNKTIIIWKFYPPSSICLRNIYMTSNRLQSSEIASKATYEFQFFSQ